MTWVNYILYHILHINNRLEKFITSNNLIDDTQIGFKTNCRTTDHMFILRTLIDKYEETKNHHFIFVLLTLEKLTTLFCVRH